jgi:hypothetical protein
MISIYLIDKRLQAMVVGGFTIFLGIRKADFGLTSEPPHGGTEVR